MANDILITTESLKTILPVYENHILEQVKNEQANNANVVEPLHDDIPTVFITGNIPTTKDYVYGELEYISKTHKFHAYTMIKLQGTSSLVYPKKNFTINLYKDEARSKKLNVEFKHWGAHNNFVLKANYIDHLHARNIVCANLWADIVRSRPDFDSLPEELKNSPNCGAVDGFPIKVYINGEYQGLYTWNIPKCDWQFGLNKNNPNHALLSSEFNDNGLEENFINPCNFNALWDGDDTYFDVEVGELTDSMIESFNGIATCVLNGDVTTLTNHLDIQSAIDYFLFQEVIGGIDGLAKNMLLVTYDMSKWYLSAYDMDSTFDLWWDGTHMVDNPHICIPNDYLNVNNQLPFMLGDNHRDEFMQRYWGLRRTVLSNSSILSRFEKFLSVADDDVRIEDVVAYPDIHLVTENTLAHLRNFVLQRMEMLDADYELEA